MDPLFDNIDWGEVGAYLADPANPVFDSQGEASGDVAASAPSVPSAPGASGPAPGAAVADSSSSPGIYGSGSQPHLSTSEAAIFATLAYVWGSGQGSDQEKVQTISEELSGTGFVHLRNMSDRQLSTFYNVNKNHVHVAHKGTQPDSAMGILDVVSDVRLGLRMESSDYQFSYRLKKTEQIYSSTKPSIFTMSGHSLGGATVIYALENSKLLRSGIDQADTFNAGATPVPRVNVSSFFYPKTERAKKKKLDQVLTHHRMEKDFVSKGMRYNAPLGEVRTYNISQAVGDDVDLTKMNNVQKGLEAHHLEHFAEEDEAHMSSFRTTGIPRSS